MRIKYLLQLGLLAPVLVVLMGCTMENYSKAVHSWEGAPQSALVQTWGEPEETLTLANGNTQYIYRESARELPTPIVSTTTHQRTNTQVVNSNIIKQPPLTADNAQKSFWCETTFEVNPSGLVVNAKYSGNNCNATPNQMRYRSYQNQ